jgi:putative transposase
MFEFDSELSIRRQAEILNFTRSRLYYKSVLSDDSMVANLIRDVYLSSDCRYGYRKIAAALKNQGDIVNRKKVLRIMREIGIEGLYPKKRMNISIADTEHKIYPYLLNDLKIEKANQVWATDVTYIKIDTYFMYFIAIIDLYSRYIVSYDLSNSLEVGFCINALKRALNVANPDIFNTDQGSQFTCHDFIEELKNRGIRISMDHTGRCFDNIFIERLWRTLKQESIYYYRPDNIRSLIKCLKEFVVWYNNIRLHQALKYRTPAGVYFGK